MEQLIDENRRRPLSPDLFMGEVGPDEDNLPEAENIAFSSDLHWNEAKYSKRDLLELAVVLHAADAFVTQTGEPADYAAIATLFSRAGNVRFGKVYNERSAIYGRMKQEVSFISKLQRILESEKIRRNQR